MTIRRLAFRSSVEYAASVRHAALDVQVLAPAQRPWRLDRRRLGEVLLEHGVEGAPFAATGTPARGTVSFTFTAGPGDGRSVDFRDVDEGVLCRLAGGSRFSLVVRRPGEWFALSAGTTVAAGLDAGSPEELGLPASLRVAPERLAQLRALAASALRVGAEGPEGQGAEGSAGLGRALLAEALHACRTATDSTPPGDGRVRIGRRQVAERLDEVLSRRASEPLYVADLCEATGLPERTLRYVVAEQYGTSPVRLLRSRRLCQVHRALLESANSEQSVAAVGFRCGFRHMGQLAADYRALFGELPSETLRRAREGEPYEAVPSATLSAVSSALEARERA